MQGSLAWKQNKISGFKSSDISSTDYSSSSFEKLRLVSTEIKCNIVEVRWVLNKVF